jgi:hypothetical protein
MAGYLWMRYSYAWELDHDSLDAIVARLTPNSPSESFYYTAFRQETVYCFPISLDYPPHTEYMKTRGRRRWVTYVDKGNGNWNGVNVFVEDPVPVGETVSLAGRVVFDAPTGYVCVDGTVSRFTGASIAGLVVGAMGVFVFTVALRHWLNQRRTFGVQTAEAVE